MQRAGVEMKFFKPEDFELVYAHPAADIKGLMADLANDKLERDGVRVYGNIARYDYPTSFSKSQLDNNTHTGLLVNIESIPQITQHEHAPDLMFKDSNLEKLFMSGVPCKHCGLNLRVKFEAAE